MREARDDEMKKFFSKRPYILFLLPGVIIYSVLVIYPILSAGYISFFEWNGIGPKTFVGLGNYVELLTSPDMMSQLWNALRNSLTIFVLTVVIQIPLQILLAYMIHSKAKGYRFTQSAIYAPQFISTPIIVFIFTLMLDGNIGFVNKIFSALGWEGLIRPWLGIPEIGIYVVWIMIAWSGIGVGMMFLVGAMKMVPAECMEAAYVEGAGIWKRLFSVILPQIKITIVNLVLISYIFSMTLFDYSYILGGTAGGIDGSVDVMSLFFYRTAFGDTNPLGGRISQNSMGMGTTIACLLFLMIFVIAIIQITVMNKREEK